jgi:hypothetical protein
VPDCRSCSTFSIAAIWALVKLSTQGAAPGPQKSSEVNLLKTCMATMSAPGATPRAGAPAMPAPSPAAIPATWVPWEQAAMVAHAPVSESAVPGPSWAAVPFGHRLVAEYSASAGEKHASAMIRSRRNGWSVATPVSRTAIALPAPVLPAAAALAPPTRGTLWSRDGGTGTSSVTLTTPGRAASSSRPPLSTLRVTTGRVSKDCSVSPAVAAPARSARFSVTTLTRTLPPSAVSSYSGGSTGSLVVSAAAVVLDGAAAWAGIAPRDAVIIAVMTADHIGLFTFSPSRERAHRCPRGGREAEGRMATRAAIRPSCLSHA